MVAQPGGDRPRVGVFECDAADGVDDLAAALAGGDGDPVAGDLNYLTRV